MNPPNIQSWPSHQKIQRILSRGKDKSQTTIICHCCGEHDHNNRKFERIPIYLHFFFLVLLFSTLKNIKKILLESE